MLIAVDVVAAIVAVVAAASAVVVACNDEYMRVWLEDTSRALSLLAFFRVCFL